MDVELKDYDKIMSQLNLYNSQVSKLTNELNKIENEGKTLIHELAIISSNTEMTLKEIEQAKTNKKNTIDQEGLHKKCSNTIGYFLQDIIDEFHPQFSVQIRIDYQHMKLFKNIVDENMTFAMLKEELTSHYGKKTNEFFFSDQNDCIFLDEIKVVPALFPLSKVLLEKSEPVLYVVDRKIHKPKIIKCIDERPKEYEEIIIQENHNTIFTAIKSVVKENTLKIIYTLCIICLIALYSENGLNYRQGDQYRSLLFSLTPYTTKFTNLTIKPDDFMNTLRDNVKYFFPISNNTLKNQGIYDSLMKMNYIRLIQKRGIKKTNCSSIRIDYKLSKECLDRYDFGKEPIQNGLYTYQNQTTYKRIRGLYYDYDNSGYILDIPIKTQEKINSTIKSLSTWINNDTASIILIMNYYSVNTDSIVILRFLFERNSTVFTSVYDLQLVYLDKHFDWYLITCIIITIIMIVLQCFLLKKPQPSESDNKDNIFTRGAETIKKKFTRYIQYTKSNFRCPHVLEIICLLNILFFYAMLIFRYNLLNEYKNHPINQRDEYEDFQGIAFNYEFITAANCFNIMVLFVDLMAILASYFDELQTITSGMSFYLTKVYYYFMLFVLPFMSISFYISYLLFGDDHMSFYKYLPFIILKVFQTFDHGSMDHEDYMNKTMTFQNKTTYEYVNNADISFRNIMETSGYTGYIIVRIISMINLVFIIVFLGVYNIDQRVCDWQFSSELS